MIAVILLIIVLILGGYLIHTAKQTGKTGGVYAEETQIL